MAIWLGIDIGKTAVKVAIVRAAYRRIALAGLAFVDVAEETGGVEEAIRTAVASAMPVKASIADGMLAVSIEGFRASVHVLGMPTSAQRQLGDVLRFELESQLPYDLDNAVFDHRVLGPRGEGELDVLAAVARIEDVQARIDIVKSALRAEPERVAVGGLTLAHLVPFTPQLAEPGPIVLLDLGTRSSEVVVFRDGSPVYSRTVSEGTAGLPGSASRLAREIRLSLGAYRAAGGTQPTTLYLCGGGAFVTGAESFLGAELEMQVELLPAPQLEMTELPPEAGPELPRFAKAIALALSLSGRGAGLNLRRGPLTYERGFGWMQEKVPLLAGLGAVILVSFVFSAWARLYSANKDADVATKALATVTREVLGEETTSAAHAQELLNEAAGKADEDPMPHADAFDVLVHFSDAVPPSMTHDVEELDFQKGHVRLQGIVPSIPDSQAIATTLKNEPCFSDVKVTRTNKMVGGDRQKYDLELDVKCPQDQKGGGKKHTGPSASAAPSAGGE